MLLRKVAASRPLRLFKTDAAWLIFCAVVFILTNAFASQDKIIANGFRAVDVVLTYGFLVFWEILEALVAAAIFVIAQILLERALRKPLDLVFRLLLLAILVGSWVALLLSIFRIL